MSQSNDIKKVLVVFGTRPEAIKMAPVIQAIKSSSDMQCMVCVTAQHRQMLDQVLEVFGIRPDFDLDIMIANQDLFSITSHCLRGLRDIYEQVRPDVVLVHGDTTTSFSAALSAYYCKIKIGHVEAGLRTGDKYAPFPEEMNRNMIAPVVDFHFSPTDRAVNNLRAENIPSNRIYKTGNTAIDSLLWVLNKIKLNPALIDDTHYDNPMILMTAHRRENFGLPFERIFGAIRSVALAHKHCQIIYPVHPNPNVKQKATEFFGDLPNVRLIEPVSYEKMVYLLKKCQFVLTDSGGLQEEAPTLGKPVLVMRETTERPEAVDAGCARLVGSNPSLIKESIEALLDIESPLYQSMSRATNPFGNGTAGSQIAEILAKNLY